MKVRFNRIHLEPVGGVAGDMLLGALIDLGADLAAIRRAFASLALPGLRLSIKTTLRQGERALKVRAIPRHSRHKHHHLDDILALVARAEATPRARRLAARVFRILAAAEGRVHGSTYRHVHLHEVGELDSILDVLGFAVAFDALGAPITTSLPLPSGSGTVKTQHGLLTCPVPAVREIARRYHVPLVAASIVGETVTPTGVAIVAAVVDRFVTKSRLGATAVGVGAGQRRFADRPNVVRALGRRRVG